jgi:hypothetical protein
METHNVGRLSLLFDTEVQTFKLALHTSEVYVFSNLSKFDSTLQIIRVLGGPFTEAKWRHMM